MSDRLFTKVSILDYMRACDAKIKEEIEKLDPKTLLQTSTEEWCNYFADKYTIDVPRLKTDTTQTDQHDANMRYPDYFEEGATMLVNGTRYSFFVPFEGDKDIFLFRPSSYSSAPQAEVVANELVFKYFKTDHDTVAVRQEFDRDIASTNQYLQQLEKDAAPFNESIQQKARVPLEQRREKLLRDQKSAEALGFPIRRRQGAPTTYVAPSVKRKSPIPPSPTPVSSPMEPTLAMQEYEHILSIISGMVKVIERSPHAFKTMGEEDLRQHFLVQLNGQYEGRATGETFNYQGKTDILIREQDRNIFIAECKFWTGAAGFTETLNQLLSYATWRDSKLCVILFNRNKNFTAVLNQIPEVLKTHNNFIRLESLASDTGFRCRIKHNDDPDRELLLTVLAFDVPI